MRFNERKFRQGTHGSHRYADWDENLLKILDEAGDRFPEYENGTHKFLNSVKKQGKYKRMKLFYIICPCDGSEITVQKINKMDEEETRMMNEFVDNFISVMTKYGYIE